VELRLPASAAALFRRRYRGCTLVVVSPVRLGTFRRTSPRWRSLVAVSSPRATALPPIATRPPEPALPAAQAAHQGNPQGRGGWGDDPCATVDRGFKVIRGRRSSGCSEPGDKLDDLVVGDGDSCEPHALLRVSSDRFAGSAAQSEPPGRDNSPTWARFGNVPDGVRVKARRVEGQDVREWKTKPQPTPEDTDAANGSIESQCGSELLGPVPLRFA
jgi:hypothetical protein